MATNLIYLFNLKWVKFDITSFVYFLKTKLKIYLSEQLTFLCGRSASWSDVLWPVAYYKTEGFGYKYNLL